MPPRPASWYIDFLSFFKFRHHVCNSNWLETKAENCWELSQPVSDTQTKPQKCAVHCGGLFTFGESWPVVARQNRCVPYVSTPMEHCPSFPVSLGAGAWWYPRKLFSQCQS